MDEGDSTRRGRKALLGEFSEGSMIESFVFLSARFYVFTEFSTSLARFVKSNGAKIPLETFPGVLRQHCLVRANHILPN
jgi:hypothetical protein